MSFDNEHAGRKDWRKPYKKKAQRVDASCRPGGDCPWCRGNRKHPERKRVPADLREQLKEAE